MYKQSLTLSMFTIKLAVYADVYIPQQSRCYTVPESV